MLIRVALGFGLLVATALIAYVANRLGFLIPVSLFVGLLAGTAIIAPWADNLGKKLGKKRISWFGLRPRTTATLATIGSSWVIMILTLTVLLVVVSPLKNALFSYERETKSYKANLAATKADLETTKRDAQKTVDGLRSQAKALQEGNLRSQEEARKSQNQAQLYQGQAKSFQQQATTARASLQTARRGEQSAKRSTQVALNSARVAQASARQAEGAAAVARAQQDAAQKALETTKRSLQINGTLLKAAQGRLKTAQARLVEANKQIKSADRQVQSAFRQAYDAIKGAEQAKQEVEKAKQEVNNLELQKKELVTQVRGYQQLSDVYGRISIALAYGDISLSVDQTLAERRVDMPRTPEDLARELRILVDAAKVTARKVLQNDRLEFTVRDDLQSKDGSPISLNETQTIDFYSNALASANQTFSVRVVSAFNYPSTTPDVVGRFVFVPVRTIYIARQNIAIGIIDPNRSQSAIFGSIQRLVEKARILAVKNGANPPIPPNLPVTFDLNDQDSPEIETQHFFDGDTGPKMFAAWQEIQKYTHPVQVRVIAARDLDSAEPLQVRFVVGDGV